MCFSGHRFVVMLKESEQPYPTDVKVNLPLRRSKLRGKPKRTRARQVILRVAGGEVLEKLPSSGDVIVISSKEMRKSWVAHAKKPNVTILSVQHLLTSVLRQELDLQGGMLT